MSRRHSGMRWTRWGPGWPYRLCTDPHPFPPPLQFPPPPAPASPSLRPRPPSPAPVPAPFPCPTGPGKSLLGSAHLADVMTGAVGMAAQCAGVVPPIPAVP